MYYFQIREGKKQLKKSFILAICFLVALMNQSINLFINQSINWSIFCLEIVGFVIKWKVYLGVEANIFNFANILLD